MGQKVNSLGIRVGINRTWSSKWYDWNKKSYSRWLVEDQKIRSYLVNVFQKENVLVGHIEVKRSKGKVFVSFPVLLPETFKNIDELNSSSNVAFWTSFFNKNPKMEALEKSIFSWLKKPTHIKIEYAKSYLRDSVLLARHVALQLEGRVSVRNILKGCLDESRKEQTVRGIRIQCSGRLDGVEMAKNVWIKDGQVPLHTLHATIDYATSSAYTIYGVCGVKAWICFNPDPTFSNIEKS